MSPQRQGVGESDVEQAMATPAVRRRHPLPGKGARVETKRLFRHSISPHNIEHINKTRRADWLDFGGKKIFEAIV
jgi:hypothetical protein